MTVIRVVIADDHPIVREGLTALLSSVPGFHVVADARTGREAVQQVVLHHPDVALLDLQMPELDGFGATREIVRSAPNVAVLVLTMHADDDSVFTAMRAGARGYLVKGAEQEEILGAIRAVAAGEVIFGPAVAQRVLAFFSGTTPAPSNVFPELTDRETKILDLLAAGLSNAEIGQRLSLAAKTVANTSPRSSRSCRWPAVPRRSSKRGTQGSDSHEPLTDDHDSWSGSWDEPRSIRAARESPDLLNGP